jgi:hypothetical protein
MSRAGKRVGVTLLLALAACGPGSQQEPLVSEPAYDAARMQLAELEALLWPKTPDQWQPPSPQQQLALDDLVDALLGYAQRGKMSDRQQRRVTRLAAKPLEQRYGRGSYLFRLGPLRGRTEYLLQAPHSRYDKHTGIIALSMFVEADGQAPRALFVNSVHRYAQADGTRGKREPARANPADATHREDHPLARATARALQAHPLALVQLHGFERDMAANDPEIIVSSGRPQASAAGSATIDRLRAGFPELRIGHFGVDTSRLGATTNVQGHASRSARRCFVHIEASEAVRDRLRSDRAARRIFSSALFGGSAQELHGGCR